MSAQDLGDETEYLGIRHGALWLPLLRPLRGTRLHGESKLTRGPRGGRGRCRSQSRAVSLSNSGGGVARPDLDDEVLGSDLKSAARESEWEASDVRRAGPPRRGTLGSRLDVRSPELGTARLLVSASCKRDSPPSVVNARHHLRTWILSELRTWGNNLKEQVELG